jgi:hypothetical protein
MTIMPTGKHTGCGLLASKKKYKATRINRKTKIQNKMNQLRTRAEICMAEIRRKNTKERKNEV